MSKKSLEAIITNEKIKGMIIEEVKSKTSLFEIAEITRKRPVQLIEYMQYELEQGSDFFTSEVVDYYNKERSNSRREQKQRYEEENRIIDKKYALEYKWRKKSEQLICILDKKGLMDYRTIMMEMGYCSEKYFDECLQKIADRNFQLVEQINLLISKNNECTIEEKLQKSVRKQNRRIFLSLEEETKAEMIVGYVQQRRCLGEIHEVLGFDLKKRTFNYIYNLIKDNDLPKELYDYYKRQYDNFLKTRELRDLILKHGMNIELLQEKMNYGRPKWFMKLLEQTVKEHPVLMQKIEVSEKLEELKFATQTLIIEAESR